MRRANSKPFWRESKGAWYCWIDGHQRSLGPKKQLAWGKYRELLEEKKEAARSQDWTVRQCFDYYLEHAASFKANTLRNRRQTLDRFCREAKVGGLPWRGLSVDHLESWLKLHADWSQSMRRSAINYVMAAFNHCVDRKKLAENPIHGLTKPRWERRREVISPEDERKVYEASKGAFRDILTVLRGTGARPGELCSARIEHYAGGIITLEEHKTDETGEDRTIYLTGEAREVAERLIGSRTEGPIFLNSRGQAWTPDTLYCRFKRLRKKLGLGDGVFPYNLRHRFTSDAINNGNANPALVAKALGHTDLKMLLKHYLKEDPEAVRRALEEINGPSRKT
jgi:integrase